MIPTLTALRVSGEWCHQRAQGLQGAPLHTHTGALLYLVAGKKEALLSSELCSLQSRFLLSLEQNHSVLVLNKAKEVLIPVNLE